MVLRLQRTATDYDRWARLNVGGSNNVNSFPGDNGLAGMGDGVSSNPLDWLAQGGQAILAPATAKLNDLDLAIKALLVMGGISALSGLVLLFRRV